MSWRASAGLLSAGAAVLVACASRSNGSAPPVITPFTSCLPRVLVMDGAVDCSICVESSCQTEGRAFEQQCASYVNCICTDGQSPSAAMIEQCAPMLSAAACMQAIAALQACGHHKCENQCGGPDAASPEDAVAPEDAGEDTQGAPIFSCSNGTGTMLECDQQPVPPSAAQQAQLGCTQVGGTPGSGCPTAGAAGCCLLPTTENCYYDPAAAAQRQATCKSAGGTWSMTP